MRKVQKTNGQRKTSPFCWGWDARREKQPSWMTNICLAVIPIGLATHFMSLKNGLMTNYSPNSIWYIVKSPEPDTGEKLKCQSDKQTTVTSRPANSLGLPPGMLPIQASPSSGKTGEALAKLTYSLLCLCPASSLPGSTSLEPWVKGGGGRHRLSL